MTSRKWVRWTPAVVVPAVIVGAAIWSAPADAAASLPAASPEKVLQLLASSSVTRFSGTLEESSDLGLPSLPSGSSSLGPGGSGSDLSSLSSALGFLTGSHTARLYADGPDRVRVQVLGSLQETDLIRNGDSAWVYDSKKDTATHLLLPAGSTEHAPVTGATPGATPTPQSLAKRFLTDVGPSTRVTVGPGLQVASRSAYDLVLTPKTSRTLVGSVRIAVDSRTGMPLSVEVMARGQKDPALQVAFSRISFSAPPAGMFSFTPPKGATVTTKSLANGGRERPLTGAATPGATASPMPSTAGTATIGSGWDEIVELPASALPSGVASEIASPLVTDLTKKVAGGRALTTSLVSVLLTSDGRVLIGAVPVDALQAAAGS